MSVKTIIMTSEGNNGYDRLHTIDVDDPNDINYLDYEVIRPISAPYSSRYGVTTFDRYAYVAFWLEHKIVIYDISDLENIQHVKTINNGDQGMSLLNVHDLVIYNGSLFVVNKTILTAMDLTNPENPKFMDDILHPNPGNKLGTINAKDGYAYYSSGNKLHIVNVTNPSNLITTSVWTPTGYPFTTLDDYHAGIEILGDYLYIAQAGSNNGVQIIDITNKEALNRVGYQSGNNVFGLSVINDDYLLFNNSGLKELYLLQITNKANPVIIDTLQDGGEIDFYLMQRIENHGGYGYVISHDSLTIVNWEDGLQYVNSISHPSPEIAIGLDITVHFSYTYLNLDLFEYLPNWKYPVTFENKFIVPISMTEKYVEQRKAFSTTPQRKQKYTITTNVNAEKIWNLLKYFRDKNFYIPIVIEPILTTGSGSLIGQTTIDTTTILTYHYNLQYLTNYVVLIDMNGVLDAEYYEYDAYATNEVLLNEDGPIIGNFQKGQTVIYPLMPVYMVGKRKTDITDKLTKIEIEVEEYY